MGWTYPAATDSGSSSTDSSTDLHVSTLRGTGAGREQRVARYTPLGAKSRELSLSQLSDQELRELLAHSQPSWTSPEMGYRR